MFDEFRKIAENRHDYAREWKARTGGKVLGYFCCYAPEEIPYAAGILPVRIDSGHKPQSLAEPHIPGIYCPFSRDCLGEALKGSYNYVDGIFMGRTCLQMVQTFECWDSSVPVAYSRYIDVPHLPHSDRTRSLLHWELQSFKRSLEKWLGQPISQGKIQEAIQVYDTNRRLLTQIYELRKADPPPLSGEEALYLVLASMLADKAEVNELLEKALRELPQRKDGPEAKTRLMVAGGENSEAEFMKLVEETGCNIVMDDSCFGSRYFLGEVPVDKYEDPLEALAARYLDKPSCPLKDTEKRKRHHYIMKLYQDWNAKGVILVHQKFCDPHEFEIPVFSKFFNEQHIPSLLIELDTTLARGQVRTRVGAFLEMIELGEMSEATA